MYTSNLGPRYTIAFTVNCVTAVMAIAAAFALRIVLGRLNKRLDRGEYVPGVPMGAAAGGNGAGADGKVKGFRFLL